ncbi:hypothetical protein Cgig2_018329 [Carnegiea gigantea]|uniref:Uncharacterized protein n=1 Tax=Carnegiea gigantea TaxID=171969 RepID=A0A9Q1QTG2_9CARY|nr:hypothetical protein Cgig2_018329 [Carnegiea gigantea]
MVTRSLVESRGCVKLAVTPYLMMNLQWPQRSLPIRPNTNGFPTSSSMKPYPCLKPNGNKMHYVRSKLKLKLTSKEISPATNANCGTLKGLRGQNANSDGRERIASPTVKAIYRTKEATTQISQHRDKRLLKHKNREDAAQKFSSKSLDHPHSAITSYKPLTR